MRDHGLILCFAMLSVLPVAAAHADEPQGECTTTVVTKCTGAYAPLAIPGATVETPTPPPAPPPVATPPPVCVRPPGAYAPLVSPLDARVATGHYEEHWEPGLFIAGASAFGVLWGFNALGSTAGGNASSLAIPIAGPFLLAGSEHDGGLVTGLLVVDGLVQAGFAAMAIGGLFTQEKVMVYDSPVAIAPWAGPTGGGLAAAGRF